jgi:C4-type Zn-finger protein
MLRWGQVAPRKECPLCGENMRLEEHESVVQIPGNLNPTPRMVREWVCPECDYFEEAEEEEGR